MKSSVSLSHLLAKLVFIPCSIPIVQPHHAPVMQRSHSFVTTDFPFLVFIVAHLVMKKNLRWGPVTPTSFSWHPSPAVTPDPFQCLQVCTGEKQQVVAWQPQPLNTVLEIGWGREKFPKQQIRLAGGAIKPFAEASCWLLLPVTFSSISGSSGTGRCIPQ